MTINNLSDVREVLCRRLEEIDDDSKPLRLERARAAVEVSNAIVNTLKVELGLSAILKGALELPFVEAPERPGERLGQATAHLTSVPALAAPVDSSKKAGRTDPLATGPKADHPWRATVHRIKG